MYSNGDGGSMSGNAAGKPPVEDRRSTMLDRPVKPKEWV